jgi:hypothetical protein
MDSPSLPAGNNVDANYGSEENAATNEWRQPEDVVV